MLSAPLPVALPLGVLCRGQCGLLGQRFAKTKRAIKKPKEAAVSFGDCRCCRRGMRFGPMIRTAEAVIDEHGNVRLLEPVEAAGARRALVTILEEEPPR